MKIISNALCLVFFILLSHVLTLKISGTATKILPEISNLEINMIQTQQYQFQFINQWVKIKNILSNKCIKFKESGQRIVQEDCGNGEEYHWIVIRNPEDQSFSIISKRGSILIDNSYNKPDNGNPILAVGMNANESQRWFISSLQDNSFKIFNKNNKKCIDLTGGSTNNGATFNLLDCDDTSKNQAFEFELQFPTCQGSSSKVDIYNKPAQIINPNNNKCLKYIKSTNLVKQFDCDNLSDFFWNFEKNDDGSHTIKSLSGDYVFNVSSGAKTNGNGIEVARKDGNEHQKFKIIDFNFATNTFYIRDKNSDKCVTIPGGNTNNDVQAQIWDCTKANKSQEFSFRMTKPFTVKDEMAEKYLNRLVRIKNVWSGTCLKFNSPDGFTYYEGCKDSLYQAFKISYSEKDNTYIVKHVLGNFYQYATGCSSQHPVYTYSTQFKWYITSDDSKNFYFKSQTIACDYCMAHGGATVGSSVNYLYPCTTASWEQHIFEPFSVSQHSLLKELIGKNVRIRNNKNSKCLKYIGNTNNIGAYDCENLVSLVWKISYNAIEYHYTITSYQSNLSIENKDGSKSAGNQIITSTTNINNIYQKWKIEEINDSATSPFLIKGIDSHKCIEITGDFTSATSKDCSSGYDNQVFSFEEVFPDTFSDHLKDYEGKWYNIQNVENSKCLKYSSANGNKVVQSLCTDLDELSWKIVKVSLSVYRIISRKGNFVLDLSEGNYANGTPILNTSQENKESQLWNIFKSTEKIFKIVDIKNGRCTDARNNESLLLYDYTSSNKYQLFKLVPVGERVRLRGYIKYSDKNSNVPLCDTSMKALMITFSNSDYSYVADLRNENIYEIYLPQGKYNRTVTMNDYYSYSEEIIINSNSDETFHKNIVYLTPVVNGWRIVLTWNSKPRDLNSVLVDPNGNVIENSNTDLNSISYLNYETKNGFGPQTISIKEVTDGVYKLYVSNFSKEVYINTSGAKMYVFHNQDKPVIIEINTKDHPSNYYYWHVFNINGNNKSLSIVNEVKLNTN